LGDFLRVHHVFALKKYDTYAMVVKIKNGGTQSINSERKRGEAAGLGRGRFPEKP
jgi:hypothetical protein